MRTALYIAGLQAAGALQLGGVPMCARSAARTHAPVMESASDTTTFYSDTLCDEDGEECEAPDDSEFTVAILGDLHIDPRKMEDYETGRQQWLPILEDAKSRGVPAALCSLGDLGESKSVRPEETQELFAGTTESKSVRPEETQELF